MPCSVLKLGKLADCLVSVSDIVDDEEEDCVFGNWFCKVEKNIAFKGLSCAECFPGEGEVEYFFCVR